MQSRNSLSDAPLSRNLLICSGFNRGDAAYIIGVLQDLGIFLDEERGRGTVSRDASGDLRLESRGAAVRGYLLADDGEEAELHDIKRLVLACAQPRSEVRFSGNCQLCPERLLVISSKAEHDGRVVRWNSIRTVVGPFGEVKTMRDRDF